MYGYVSVRVHALMYVEQMCADGVEAGEEERRGRPCRQLRVVASALC